ncbi:pirin family protein [Streptomyces albicerus]|uniref:pirin family protein n=1 Tax=Streptomyces albicerus TaxID=2569859 RepID=UPI00124B9601|nr:pirin family protein [Streptomyces albicerus]
MTLVLDGVLEHGDSIGNSGTLTAGGIQWMTAGRGIIHRELAFRNERAHILQLWVNLPADKKIVDSRYQDLLAADRPTIDHGILPCDVSPAPAGRRARDFTSAGVQKAAAALCRFFAARARPSVWE